MAASMRKLFVAVNLPDEAKDELASIQRPPSQGVRPTNAQQLHITLHFIGLAASERIEQALNAVTSAPFSLSIASVGHFQSSDGGVILFAKLHFSQELLHLHAQTGEALATTGFQVETRPYAPHITLARCHRVRTPGLPRGFLEQHQGLLLPDFPVTEFVLYSSESSDRGPIYRPIRAFPLRDPSLKQSD